MISKRSISKVAKRLSRDYVAGRFDGINEADTTNKLVQPFLESFGWLFSSDNVSSQKVLPVSGVPDVVFKTNGHIRVAIEIKRVDDMHLSQYIESQLAGYFNDTEADIGILTNGIQYWFFSWYKKKPQMNPTPFAIIDIRELDLNGADSFLIYFRHDKFNSTFFKWFSHADYISSHCYALLGAQVATNKKTKRLARKIFFHILQRYRLETSAARSLPDNDTSKSSRKLKRTEINALWKITHYHSRWAYSHSRTHIKPMM